MQPSRRRLVSIVIVSISAVASIVWLVIAIRQPSWWSEFFAALLGSPAIILLNLLSWIWVSHLRETDKRRDREDQLVEKDVLLKSTMNNIDEMIVTIDEGGLITSFNRAAERAFGYAVDAIIGQNVATLMPEPNRSAHDLYLDTYHRTGAAKIIGKTGRVLDARRADGTQFSVELFVTEMRVGAHRHFIGAMRDISARLAHEAAIIEATEQANAANHAKSLFLANMSHELRTPLNAIIGFSDVINQELFGPVGNPNYREYIRDIHNSGAHLLQVINDVLDIAKVNSGKMTLYEDVVDMRSVIDASLRLVQDRAHAGGLVINTRIDPAAPHLRADEGRLRQILLNALTNAVKFTEPGGQITVETAVAEGGDFLLRVIDTGIGIAPEDMRAVLEPFGQVDSSFTRNQQGTGLGIPLTKKLIELHGGRLMIESTKGIGTRISASFPASRIVRPGRALVGTVAAA